MPDDPIRIGSVSGATLIPDQGSSITTSDFGVQRGTIRHFLSDQSLVQASRFNLGSSYTGSLPQFSTFFVEKSGDIQGIDGKCCYLDVTYARIDPLWVKLAKVGRDLEIKQIKVADTVGFGTLLDSFLTVVIPIAHPLVTYRYSSSSIPGQIGVYSSNAAGGAPTISNQVIPFNVFDFTNPSLDIEQKSIAANGVLIQFNAGGGCTRTNFSTTTTFTGFFVTSPLGLVNTMNVTFSPNPAGWLCIKEDANPIANGQVYEIEQQWKMTMIYSGVSPGTWWQTGGGHRVTC